jgi:hypothetical protein
MLTCFRCQIVPSAEKLVAVLRYCSRDQIQQLADEKLIGSTGWPYPMMNLPAQLLPNLLDQPVTRDNFRLDEG